MFSEEKLPQAEQTKNKKEKYWYKIFLLKYILQFWI